MNSHVKKNIIKAGFVIELILIGILCCSCQEAEQGPLVDERMVHSELLNTLNDIAIENAIVKQRTLYPYHFVEDSEQLNELGQRDLSILAKHLKDYPGIINIRKDNAGDSLYDARIANISDQLQQAGVDLSQIKITDGMSGGRGMASSDVLQIKEADQEARSDRRTQSFESD